MARTTLDIDASVLEQLRRRARLERKSMGQVASERLAGALQEQPPGPPPAFAWPRQHMGTPRLDLTDKEALWRALDGRSADS